MTRGVISFLLLTDLFINKMWYKTTLHKINISQLFYLLIWTLLLKYYTNFQQLWVLYYYDLNNFLTYNLTQLYWICITKCSYVKLYRHWTAFHNITFKWFRRKYLFHQNLLYMIHSYCIICAYSYEILCLKLHWH